MSYYATGSGAIELRSNLNEDNIREIEEILDNADVECDFSRRDGYLDLYQHEKYYGDYWEDLLGKLAPFTSQGEIDFNGEDGSLWRFIFRDGTFVEENGDVVFESDAEGNRRRISALRSILDRMTDVLETSAVYESAVEAGLNDDDLRALCLEYIIPENKERKE